MKRAHAPCGGLRPNPFIEMAHPGKPGRTSHVKRSALESPTQTTSSMKTRTASCSCGQLSVTTRGEPWRVSICHCLACQRRTGSVFGAQARFPRDAVEIKGESRQWVRVSDDGSKVTFNFCPTCGSTVHYAVEGYDEESIAIAVGSFAEPDFPAPTFSVYEERMHRWVNLPSGMEHMP